MPGGWPWPDDDVGYFVRKARRSMVQHESSYADELIRALLIWLALCGMNGAPVADLADWTRSAPLARLRDLVLSFDTPGLREWVEKQVGYPSVSRVVYQPGRPLRDGMRTR